MINLYMNIETYLRAYEQKYHQRAIETLLLISVAEDAAARALARANKKLDKIRKGLKKIY